MISRHFVPSINTLSTPGASTGAERRHKRITIGTR
jgi:hypothetical protein